MLITGSLTGYCNSTYKNLYVNNILSGCVVGVGFSFERDSDYGPYLSHLDFCVILLQAI